MLSHVSLGVSDLQRSIRFYDAILAALGWVRVWKTETGAGYGSPGGNDKLAIFQVPLSGHPLAAGRGFHIAFTAPDREAVHAFHAAAMEQGGADDGKPGPRPQYSDTYYAAFVIDPDGHALEAVHQ